MRAQRWTFLGTILGSRAVFVEGTATNVALPAVAAHLQLCTRGSLRCLNWLVQTLRYFEHRQLHARMATLASHSKKLEQPTDMSIPHPPASARMIPLAFRRLAASEMLARGRAFYDEMSRRRTTRHFSSDPVPREAIEWAIRIAATAPSGAHQQPWTFVAVSDADLKARMRDAAEREEHAFYHGRAPDEWLEALAPLGTDEHKTHLTDAPWVVVLFRQSYGLRPDGSRRTHYYSQESCGIAAGFFLAAIHMMGLVALTHTPSPMAFLGELLQRPVNEKAMLVMPVGYPADGALVPDLTRKLLDAVSVWQ